MRIGMWCVVLCFVCGGCVTPDRRCEGPLQPINAPPQSKSVQTPAPAEPDGPVQ